MTPRLNGKFILVLLALTSVAGSDSRGQSDVDTTQQVHHTPRRNAPGLASNSPAPTHPSLQELKRIGASQSSYRIPSNVRRSVPSKSVIPQASLATYRKQIAPILQEACVDCHGAESQEGNIRIDTLNPDLFHGDDVNWWLEVLAVLTNGEMPPPDEAEITDDERTKVIDWLSAEIQAASATRRAEGGHSSFRRMTRYEYNYALQDLLGLPNDFAKDLPPESTSEDGFQNSSELLQMSTMQFETYTESARQALQQATIRGDRPDRIWWGVSMAAAWDDAWARHEKELEKIRHTRKGEPEKLERELQRRTDSFRGRSHKTHFKELSSGKTANASWSYGGAKYAWAPATTAPVVPATSDYVAVIPRKQKLIVELGDTVPDRGTLRVRVRAAKSSTEGAPTPSLQLEFGWQASNDSAASVRISETDMRIDATEDQPRFYQWDIPLSEIYPRNSVRNISQMGDLPSPSEFVKLVNSSESQTDIQLDYVEIIAPVYDHWPPESHNRIFIASQNKTNEPAYAREVLSNFMSRAWRRNVNAAEIDQKMVLFAKIRTHCRDFEEAMIEVLASVISSPNFLYVGNRCEAEQATLNDDDSEVASLQSQESAIGSKLSPAVLRQANSATQLSFFLWSSLPDEELLQLAMAGRLRETEVWEQQVERMLKDPRIQRLAKHFPRQWLGMSLLDFLDVDEMAYPQFDRSLKEAMQEEPIAFFREVLRNNHSVLDFLHAEYTMSNERLARHYGLKNVFGNHFRRVPIDVQHPRGGLLTQAGLLAMNSDGKDSHPLKRGIWLLERILNDPPPPPPPAVPEIDLADPKIAKMTLKQRIEDHRNQPACISCHAKIDPWGIAFENYDAIGSWRDEIRSRPVDATSVLFNGQRLNGMDGLKRFLLEHRQDQFVRAMVYKMATYGVGRPLSFRDRATIERIVADVRKQGDGLATMIKLIATSELFSRIE